MGSCSPSANSRGDVSSMGVPEGSIGSYSGRVIILSFHLTVEAVKHFEREMGSSVPRTIVLFPFFRPAVSF